MKMVMKKLRRTTKTGIFLFLSVIVVSNLAFIADSFAWWSKEDIAAMAEGSVAEREACLARNGQMQVNGECSVPDPNAPPSLNLRDPNTVAEASSYLAAKAKEERNACLAAGGEMEINGCNYNPANCGYPSEIKSFIEEMQKFCWSCVPLHSMIVAMQEISTVIYENVVGGVIQLMGAILTIWLLLTVIQYITVFRYKSSSEFYTDIGKKVLRVGFAAFMVGMGTNLWSYTVLPVFDIMFSYSTVVMELQEPTVQTSDPFAIIGTKIVGDDASTAGGIISAINSKIMKLLATGWVMVTAAARAGDYCIPFNHWGLFLFGVLVLFTSFLFLLLVPLKFVDILFRLGIFLVLLPLFILAWAFPISRDFFMKGARLLINVAMTFLIYAITIAICFKLLDSELGLPDLTIVSDTANAANEMAYVVTTSPSSEFKHTGEVTPESLDAALKAFDGGWLKLFTFLAYMLYSFLIINLVDIIANRLSGVYYNPSQFATASRNVDGLTTGKSEVEKTMDLMASSTGNLGIGAWSVGKGAYNYGKRKYKQKYV